MNHQEHLLLWHPINIFNLKDLYLKKLILKIFKENHYIHLDNIMNKQVI